jgi:hypothetical protein
MPDASCYPTLVDPLLNGSIIDGYIGLVVDGSCNKAALPEWAIRQHRSQQVRPDRGRVTRDEDSLSRLLHELEEGTYDFDPYLQRAGFVVAKSL